jgi:hypothetical protein
MARQHRYLNVGLLSIASDGAERYGLTPWVHHGHFDTVEAFLNEAEDHGLSHTRWPVFLSLPSFYSLPWARECLRRAHERWPHLSFVVGGRWVVGGRPERLLRALCGDEPLSVQVIPGLWETSDLARQWDAQRRLPPRAPLCGPPRLDYRWLHQRSLYQPSIEIARGCGQGCAFCSDQDVPLQRLKPVDRLIAEIKDTVLEDEQGLMTPYFETAVFAPSAAWVRQLNEHWTAHGLRVQWRTQARVDSLHPDRIPALAAAGLSILDVGLESASPLQLARMKKNLEYRAVFGQRRPAVGGLPSPRGARESQPDAVCGGKSRHRKADRSVAGCPA